MKQRITNREIESTIELFVNCIYDEDYHGVSSGWANAKLESWIKAVYFELAYFKNDDGCIYRSNENRFDGKNEIVNRITPMIIKRLTDLQEELIKDHKNITIMAVVH